MRRNPTNKSKVATAEIAEQVTELKECMTEANIHRDAVLGFMGEASFLTDAEGNVLAQRLRTKSGRSRLELV